MNLFNFIKIALVGLVISTKTYSFDSFYELDGKSIGLAYSVFQGKEAIWIGSENGLFKITGLHVEAKSTNENPFNGFDVEGIAEDKNGKVWITLFGNGVVVYDQNLNYFEHFTVNSGLGSSYCLDVKLYEDEAYINCEKVISIIDIETFRISNITPTSESNFHYIEDIQITNSGNLIFLDSENELFNIKNGKLSNYNPLNVSKKDLRFNSFHSDSNGNLWLAINKSLFKVVNFSLVEVAKMSKEITKIFTYDDERLMFLADSLYSINLKNTEVFSPIPILKANEVKIEKIYDVDITHTGGVIFAAPLIGIGVFNELTSKIEPLLPKIYKSVNIQASSEIGNSRLALAFENDISILENTDKSLKTIVSKIGVVTAMVFDQRKSRLLLGIESKGLFEIVNIGDSSSANPQFNSIFESEGLIVDIAFGLDGKINFGIIDNETPGVYELDINDNPELIFSNRIVDSLFVKSNGDMYASTRYHGIFDIANSIQISNSTKNGYINNCLIEDNRGVVWLCTDGAGLAYLDQLTGELQFIDTKYTANSRHIRELVQDTEGYFWVMTNHGLVRYDHTNKTSIKLGPEDGIKDIDFEITASINLSNNRILIAGDKENYVINTSTANVLLNKRLERINETVFVDLNVLLRDEQGMISKKTDLMNSINSNLPLEFTHDEFVFELTFAANNFVDRNVLRFQYRLVGLNNSWVDTTAKNTTATYSTLPTGDYLFEVRVIDPKSATIQPINSLQIKVLPPYWQTWQAYIIYVAATLLALFSFFKYRTFKLKSLNERLESSVLVQTKELATSRRKLSDMLQQKELLYANASHEFRTPLTLISGPIEQLANSIQDEESRSLLDILRINAFRLTNLVDQILELSKIDSKKLEDRVHYDLHTSIQVIVESFRSITLIKNQKLKFVNLCTGTGVYIADSLEKIISNLLNNAFKYNSEEGEVEVKATIDNDTTFKLEVTDHGEGIPPDQIERIFQRFTRLDNASETRGSGLGLAVVKELVIANGGTIDIKSEIGVGTTFSVCLPISDDLEVKESILFVSAPIVNTVEMEFNNTQETTHNTLQVTEPKVTVLIVEDQVDMRNYLNLIFRKHYKCYTAANGQEGIEKAIEIIPDVIVSDLMMPVLDGFQLCEKIRENELTSHIPIIMLTAKGDDETRLSSWGYHVDDYIKKPFSNVELLARAENLLSIRRTISEKYTFSTVKNKDVFALNNDGNYSERDSRFYDKYIAWLDSNYRNDNANRGKAAAELAVSERQLNRKLSAFTNFSFNDLLRKYRLIKAKTELLNGKQITETAFNVGFASSSYFSNQFKKEFGLSPKAYVEKMKAGK